MPYDVNKKTTDIIMCNSKNLGALIVKDEPHVKSWDEPQYSIHNIGIEESYGFGVLNEGQVERKRSLKSCFLCFLRSYRSLARLPVFPFTAANGNPGRRAGWSRRGLAPVRCWCGENGKSCVAGDGVKGWLVSCWWVFVYCRVLMAGNGVLEHSGAWWFFSSFISMRVWRRWWCFRLPRQPHRCLPAAHPHQPQEPVVYCRRLLPHRRAKAHLLANPRESVLSNQHRLLGEDTRHRALP
jgi:hypothetical protein